MKDFYFHASFLKCKTAKVELNLKFSETKTFQAQTNKRLGILHFFLRPENPQFLHFKKRQSTKNKVRKNSGDRNMNRLSFNVLALGEVVEKADCVFSAR
jgi:hypothetical protein